jgi:site-specific DNA recombinase
VTLGPSGIVAAIYARKSTEQTGVADEQKSVARQVEHARHYASRKGWTVDEGSVFIDDGISGAEFSKRPGFLRLMNALKPRPAFQVLVMSEESRLGREAIETAYALKQLITAGVRVFFYLEDRERTLDSPTDKIMLSLTAFADELEREKARQRTADAMVRKARAGHVTGGRVFGYDNVEVLDHAGQRSHVERRINDAEAVVVRRIFELSAGGQGVRSITKLLNAAGEPAPRAQQGRPVAWAPSSVWAILRRPLYRGEVVWNQTKKRDTWGRKRQQPRDASEWLRQDRPDLRIVPDDLWRAAHERLAGAKDDYVRRNAGRSWGRPTNGTESKYLLTGLAQCGRCNGGLCVQTRSHGGRRAFFYACSSYYHRGRSVCDNGQALPMERINWEVLDAFRTDLLNPAVLERALAKLQARLVAPTCDTGLGQLEAEQRRLRGEIERLTAALAAGGALSSLLAAIRQREERLEAVRLELHAANARTHALDVPISVVMPEVRRRLDDWRSVLSDESSQSRQMLRLLLRGRLVFTPRDERRAVRFSGEGDLGQVFSGLIDSQALASPTGAHLRKVGERSVVRSRLVLRRVA